MVGGRTVGAEMLKCTNLWNHPASYLIWALPKKQVGAPRLWNCHVQLTFRWFHLVVRLKINPDYSKKKKKGLCMTIRRAWHQKVAQLWQLRCRIPTLILFYRLKPHQMEFQQLLFPPLNHMTMFLRMIGIQNWSFAKTRPFLPGTCLSSRVSHHYELLNLRTRVDGRTLFPSEEQRRAARCHIDQCDSS